MWAISSCLKGNYKPEAHHLPRCGLPQQRHTQCLNMPFHWTGGLFPNLPISSPCSYSLCRNKWLLVFVHITKLPATININKRRFSVCKFPLSSAFFFFFVNIFLMYGIKTYLCAKVKENTEKEGLWEWLVLATVQLLC